MREQDARTIAALRKWSVLLDSAFRVPGTKMTFGLDPLIGLIPGFGDFATPLFAALLLVHAFRFRIPRVVQLRMLMNAVIDFGIGSIPVAGDIFDFGWKANVRNLDLLERYAGPGAGPSPAASPADWTFVLIGLTLLAALAVIPMMIALWLLLRFRLI